MGTSSFAAALVACASISLIAADETCLLQRAGGGVTDSSWHLQGSEKSPACTDNPVCKAAGLAGTCCPTDAGAFLECCDDASARSPACTDNPVCKAAGLTGTCCPTDAGAFLECCGDAPAPASSPAPTSPACADNPGCNAAGLTGTCCPTEAGAFLGCCGDSRAPVPATSPAPGQAAAPSRGWLGRSYWVSKLDLWSFSGQQNGVQVYKAETPDECFTEVSCGTSSASKFQTFKSVKTWADSYASGFGLGLKGTYDDFSGSISASLGLSEGSAGAVSRSLSQATKTNKRKCYDLVSSERCRYNEEYVEDQFWRELKTLPQGKPYSADRMEQWKTVFVKRYGTHIRVSSVHGSRIQALASRNSRDSSANSCNTANLCGSLGWAELQFGACQNTSSCTADTNMEASETLTCAALGGDPALQSQVCSTSRGNMADFSKKFADWENGGDLDSDSSAIGYTYVSISDFLLRLDAQKHGEVAATVAKAIEYSNCMTSQMPPMQAWIDETCKCIRKCENKGTLDATSCSCNCRGDEKHGYDGSTCESQYGKCQPGPNTGNPGAANKCPIANSCSSDTSHKQCPKAAICCASDFGTACCDFGESCNCGSFDCHCHG